MNPGVIAAVVASITTALSAYLLAVRRMSGKISTTSAEELWAEARDIRKDYREQIKALNERIIALVAQNSSQQEELKGLRGDFEACQKRLYQLEKEVSG